MLAMCSTSISGLIQHKTTLPPIGCLEQGLVFFYALLLTTVRMWHNPCISPIVPLQDYTFRFLHAKLHFSLKWLKLSQLARMDILYCLLAPSHCHTPPICLLAPFLWNIQFVLQNQHTINTLFILIV